MARGPASEDAWRNRGCQRTVGRACDGSGLPSSGVCLVLPAAGLVQLSRRRGLWLSGSPAARASRSINAAAWRPAVESEVPLAERVRLAAGASCSSSWLTALRTDRFAAWTRFLRRSLLGGTTSTVRLLLAVRGVSRIAGLDRSSPAIAVGATRVLRPAPRSSGRCR